MKVAYVSVQVLSGVVGEQNSDDLDVVLLGRHVQRCEPVLQTFTPHNANVLPRSSGQNDAPCQSKMKFSQN